MTDLDHEIAIFRPLDGAIDDFTHAVFELIILAFALIFTHTLYDDLLGSPARQIRPKSIGGSGSTICSPNLMSGRNFTAI